MRKMIPLFMTVLCFCGTSYALDGIILGSGTAVDPYLIEDTADFLVFGDPANEDIYCADNIHVMLIGDLDFSGAPPFNDALINPQGSFEGFFYGNNKTISNVDITADASTTMSASLGIFADVKGAVITDLSVLNFNITSSRGVSSIGAIAGGADFGSRIENCHTSCQISYNNFAGTKIGGIAGSVGHGNTVIRNCSADVTINSSNNNCGGIVGYCTGRVSNCRATGSITARSDVGGIVGTLNGGDVIQCSSTANINSTGSGFDAVGGLVGGSNGGIIEKSYAAAAVHANSSIAYAGGLVGKVNGDLVVNCYSACTITTPSSRAGAFIGDISFDINLVSGCFWNKDKTPDMRWTSGAEGQQIAGATGLTAAQMKDRQIYIDAGWNFYDHNEIATPFFWHIHPDLSAPELVNCSNFYTKLSKGDINADGTVDMEDLAIISQNWMTQQ